MRAGIIAVVLLGVLAITGGLLSLHYVPTSIEAHASVTTLTYAVAFGAPLRRVHRLASDLLLVMVFLHLARVALVACGRGRRAHYFVGLGLALVTLVAAWTGFALPWDEAAYWGERVASLPRLHALHVTIAPMFLMTLGVWHVGQGRFDRQRVAQEAPVALAVLAVLLLAGLLAPATVGVAMGTGPGPDPVKAPWYLLGLQEMVSYAAVAGGIIYPGVVGALLIALPWTRAQGDIELRSLATPRTILATASLVVFFVLTQIACANLVADEALVRLPNLAREVANPAVLALLLALVVGGVTLWRQRSARTAVLAMLGILVVGLLWFGVLGALRGPGWTLPWPFGRGPHGS